MELIKLIKDKRRDVNFRNIGIITHYKAQKTMIQKDLDKEFDRKGWGISIFIALSSFSVELKRRKRGWKERRKWNLTPGACIDPGNIEQGDQDAGSTDLCWEGSVVTLVAPVDGVPAAFSKVFTIILDSGIDWETLQAFPFSWMIC